MPGCLCPAEGAVGGCAGDVQCLLAWAARDGARPTVVPPSAPSWQLLLNLLFIACQKLPGCFAPPLPFNPDFHHSPGWACPPLCSARQSWGSGAVLGSNGGSGSAKALSLSPHWATLHPKCSLGLWGLAARGWRQLGEQWVNPRDVGDVHCSPRWDLPLGEDLRASWRGVSCTREHQVV